MIARCSRGTIAVRKAVRGRAICVQGNRLVVLVVAITAPHARVKAARANYSRRIRSSLSPDDRVTRCRSDCNGGFFARRPDLPRHCRRFPGRSK